MMKAVWGIVATAMVTGTANAQASAPITGVYTVEGSCPGQNGTYRGVLTITKPDALYSLRWVIGSGQVSTARAIEQDGRLAITYELEGSGGVMLTRPTADGWQGSWAMFRSNTTCWERWRRR